MTGEKNKRVQLLDMVQAQPYTYTRQDLMEALGLSRAGLSSQLSYLTARGKAMAEVDKQAAEFVMENESGKFFVGTIEDYEAAASRRAAKAPAQKKVRSASQVLEACRKREADATKKYDVANNRANTHEGDPVYEAERRIAEMQLQVASMKLSAAEQGNFSYESGRVVDDADFVEGSNE